MNKKEVTQSEKQKASLRFYSLLGIPLLKRLIMGSIGKFVLRVNRREEMPSYFIGNTYRISSLIKTLKWTYFNEVVHLMSIFISAGIGYFFLIKGYIVGVFFIGIVILLNIGLVFLQHLNRVRINQTINALEKRKIKQSEH
jgi:hypothetical protein